MGIFKDMLSEHKKFKLTKPYTVLLDSLGFLLLLSITIWGVVYILSLAWLSLLGMFLLAPLLMFIADLFILIPMISDLQTAIKNNSKKAITAYTIGVAATAIWGLILLLFLIIFSGSNFFQY